MAIRFSLTDREMHRLRETILLLDETNDELHLDDLVECSGIDRSRLKPALDRAAHLEGNIEIVDEKVWRLSDSCLIQ